MNTYIQVMLRRNSDKSAKRFKEMMQGRSEVRSCDFYRADTCILQLQLETPFCLEGFIQNALSSTGCVEGIQHGQRYRRLSEDD